MALTPGTRLGAYEIAALIGAGGMGEVYRARDTRLNRDVALKVLPELFAADPDRLARFKREAQLLASLNHPNIAAIYGFEESALAMELVDGATLADRIAQGAIPIDEALPIARQITEALEAAHEQGVIHRDLKPANIKVRPDGTVKVLDFGLAKALEPGAGSGGFQSDTISPTVTSPAATRLGVILGTAAYMSPEQARGKPVDKRTDIWAFGCVLYEMLTGRPAFGGNDVVDVVGAVIHKNPGWESLPAQTPPAVLKLLRRTLEKDRNRRLADAADARIEIEDALSGVSELFPTDAATRIHQASIIWRVATVVAAVLAIAATVLVYVLRPSSEASIVRFFVSPPEGWSLQQLQTPSGAAPLPVAVSPDGRRLAFVARSADGTQLVWLHAFDALVAQPLAGTEGAELPFWSPDGRDLAFFADGRLKKISVAGSLAVTLAEAPRARGGTWSRDGVIVFAPTPNSGLYRVSAAGGSTTPVTTVLDGDGGHTRPFFLPDGRHFLYRAGLNSITGPIYVGSLDSSERKALITTDNSNVVYAGGHLLFLQETTLMAQPFDVERLETNGDPFPLAQQVRTVSTPGVGIFSASDNGVLVYQSGTRAARQLTWLDRSGTPLGVLGEPANYSDLEFSADRARLAVSVSDSSAASSDVWVFDVTRGVRSRLTFDAASDSLPVWSPDGKQIVFASRRGGDDDLYVRSASGAGNDEVLLRAAGGQRPSSWSHDGEYLLYESGTPPELWVLRLTGDRQGSPLVRVPSSAVPIRPRFSPDGRWVAYTSEEAGRAEIYVTPFPGAAGKWQVSTAGGQAPRWRQDGKEIYYLAADGRLMVAEVNGEGDTFQVGLERALFEVPRIIGQVFYDMDADGQRFLVSTLPEDRDAAPVTVVLNWTTGLEK